MNDILDAAALNSAHALRAAARTPFVRRVRTRAAVVRAVAETAWELGRPVLQDRLREIGRTAPGDTARTAVDADPSTTPEATNHGPLAPVPEGALAPGDAERCTCSGVGSDWCGATKRDVMHDLTTRGARLSTEQAEHIWATAQATRAETHE